MMTIKCWYHLNLAFHRSGGGSGSGSGGGFCNDMDEGFIGSLMVEAVH